MSIDAYHSLCVCMCICVCGDLGNRPTVGGGGSYGGKGRQD